MNTELTIVIPAKNEEKYIGKLLDSILAQDYPAISDTKIFIADAGSTDETTAVIESYKPKLEIEVIPGGLPAAGRNNGARRATSSYILFLDADVELRDTTLIRRTLELAKQKRLSCVGAYINSPEGSLLAKIIYTCGDVVQFFSQLAFHFACGMYVLYEKTTFIQLGGFDERATYAEDYLLSQKVSRKQFRVIHGFVSASDRRYKKIGYTKVCLLFLDTWLHSRNKNYYYKPRNYWG